MRALDNLLVHPAKPVRAIFLRRIPGEANLWQANYSGDDWSTAWRTVPGERSMGRDAFLTGDLRHGLPIIDEDGFHPLAPSRPAPRRADWPGGHAA